MTLISMEAWTDAEADLSHEQAAEIARLELVEVVALSQPGRWKLVGNSRVGVAVGKGWEIRVAPRIAVPKLFFLLAYAADPKGWRDEVAKFGMEPDLLDAVASGFSWHALRAVDRGLLRGYINFDERLATIRGRIRFGDQIARGAGLPLPVEVSYEEYTEDVLENQMLKSAVLALLRLRRIPGAARKRLLKLRGVLDSVSVIERPREANAPLFTRLNEHYGAALRLAELILHASSIDTSKGSVEATAFVFDMNTVFEDFVTIALREATLDHRVSVKGQWSCRLDEEGRIGMRPDITWWEGGSCLAVADAKYKRLKIKSMPNADAYQMLAYCTRLGLRRGYLVYAADSGEQSRSHTIIGSGCVIEVRTLDVEAAPELLLKQVGALAREIAGSAQSLQAA